MNQSYLDNEKILFYKVEFILQVYGGLLLFTGIPANILCGVVMGTDRSNHFTTRLLMVLLAVTDSIVLITALLRYWMIETFKFDIRSINHLTCILHTFLVSVSTDTAIITLCALAIERFIVVGFPYKSTRLVTLKNLIISITIVYLILILKNTFNLLAMGIKATNVTSKTSDLPIKPICVPKKHMEKYVEAFVKIDFITYSVLPYFILFSTNVYIFIVLRRQNRILKNHLNNSNSRNVENRKKKKSRGRQSQNIIKILTALTVVHMVTSIPGMIFNVQLLFFKDHLRNISRLKRRLISDGLMMLMFTNNATNFLAYLISSNSFRKRILGLLPNCLTPRDTKRDSNQNICQEMTTSPPTNYQKIGATIENSKTCLE